MTTKKRKKKKHPSRADRLSDVSVALSNLAQKIAEATTVEEVNALIDEVDSGEVEGLLEEISSWRDNIEEKFSATQKFSDLEECAGALEEILGDIEGIQGDHIESMDERDDVVSALEDAENNCGNVSFPGMFG